MNRSRTKREKIWHATWLILRHTILFVFLSIFFGIATMTMLSKGQTGSYNLAVFLWFYVTLYWQCSIAAYVFKLFDFE